MRILCFTESLAAGGAQRQLVNLAILFSQAGHDVTFLVYRNNPFFLSELESVGICVKQSSNENYLNRLFSCRKIIRDLKPDILLSFLETPNFISCFSSIGTHKWKLITTELSAKSATFKGFKSKLFLFFERFSDAIVCNSKNAEKMWLDHCPQYKKKLTTIYNPVLIKDLPVQANKCNQTKTIVIPASYQFLKNPIGLIEAINTLPKVYREQIKIEWYGKKEPTLGNTDAYDSAIQLVHKYNLENCVYLHGETKQIYEQISRADAVGLFSNVEGLPNAVCEGMMLGKPIIMTRVSDYNTFSLANGVFLCDSNNVESIAQALIDFLNTSNMELKEKGVRNKQLALELFGADRIEELWEHLFQAVIE